MPSTNSSRIFVQFKTIMKEMRLLQYGIKDLTTSRKICSKCDYRIFKIIVYVSRENYNVFSAGYQFKFKHLISDQSIFLIDQTI